MKSGGKPNGSLSLAVVHQCITRHSAELPNKTVAPSHLDKNASHGGKDAGDQRKWAWCVMVNVVITTHVLSSTSGRYIGTLVRRERSCNGPRIVI